MLLRGVEPGHSLPRVNRAKSPRRVPPVGSRACSLAREGLVSGYRDPLASMACMAEEIIPQKNMR